MLSLADLGPEHRLSVSLILRSAIMILVLVGLLAALSYAARYLGERAIFRTDSNTSSGSTTPLDAFNRNDFAGSLKALDAEIASDPGNAALLVQKASTLAQQGSLEFKEKEYGIQAIAVAQKALALDPQDAQIDAEAWRVIGYANEIMQEYEQAHAAYARSLALNPHDTQTISQEAHAYDLQGQLDKAEAGYKAALAINPGLDQALMGTGRILFAKGAFLGALPTFLAVASSTANTRTRAEALTSAAMILSADNDHARAEVLFTRAVAIDPTYAQSYVGLAAQEFYDTATSTSDTSTRAPAMQHSFEHLARALALQHDNAAALYQLALELAFVGDTAEAITVVKHAADAVVTDITLSAAQRPSIAAGIKALSELLTRRKAAIDRSTTQLADAYCFSDGCVNWDQMIFIVDPTVYAAGQSLMYSLDAQARAYEASNVDAFYGLSVLDRYDASGLLTTVSCSNGIDYAYFSPSAAAHYSQASYYAQGSYCAASYSCSGNTIMQTKADCSSASTGVVCAAPSFCSTGVSYCMNPSIAFNGFTAYPGATRAQLADGTYTGTYSGGTALQMDGHLIAVPTLVKPGATTQLFWNTSNTQACAVTEPNGTVISTTKASGQYGVPSTPITSSTAFTLHCTALPRTTPDHIDETVTVKIIPDFQER